MGCTGDDRAFARICERLEFTVHLGPGLARSRCYRVGGGLVILIPEEWARVGRAVEVTIAYQLGRAVLDVAGEDAVVAGLARLLGGGLVSPLADPGGGVAAH